MSQPDAVGAARIHRYRDPDGLAEDVAQRLVTHLAQLQRSRPAVHLCLGAGGVADAVITRFGAAVPGSGLDPHRLELWWSDEHYVAAGDERRHSHHNLTTLAANFPLDPARTHLMPTPVGSRDVATAALAYAAELGETRFDVALLAMGPDGHVAALGSCPDEIPVSTLAAGCVGDSTAAEGCVTLTRTALNRSRHVWILAVGDEAADVVPHVVSGRGERSAAHVRGTEATHWFVDEPAAAQLVG